MRLEIQGRDDGLDGGRGRRQPGAAVQEDLARPRAGRVGAQRLPAEADRRGGRGAAHAAHGQPGGGGQRKFREDNDDGRGRWKWWRRRRRTLRKSDSRQMKVEVIAEGQLALATG